MAKRGSSILGSRSQAAADEAAATETDPHLVGDQVDHVPHTPRQKTPLNLMSPLRIGFVGALGVLLAYALAQAVLQARTTLILLVVSLFIALGLNPIVRGLTQRGLKRGLSVLVTVLLVVVALGLVVLAIVPTFVEQIGQLVQSAPDILADTLRNPQVNALNERYQVVDRVRDAVASGGLVQQAFGSVLGAGAAVLGAIFNGLTLLILSLYFLVALPSLKAAIVRLAPASRRDRTSYLTDQIFLRISSYISGTFVVALVAGVVSYIFLLVVGLGEYALALAVLVAVLDIIPLIGATLGAIVVTIIGFVESPTIGIICAAFYLFYQQFENYVVQPRVFKSAVDVPGILVVIGALVGGALLGIVGALLAVPVVAVALLILREVAQPRLDAS